MKNKYLQNLLWACIIILHTNSQILAEETDGLVHHKITFCRVPGTEKPPVLDGLLDDPCWQNGTRLENFVLTAGEHGEPAGHKTVCTLLFDETHLYAAFKCTEPDIKGLKNTSKMWDDLDILYDDRVEIFLDINHDHRSYMELVVNPGGVQFDQFGFNRFHGSKTCDMDPSKNCFWRTKTNIGDQSWTAEIAVDVTSLGIPVIEHGMTWGFNAARVRQPDVVKGDEFFGRKPSGPAEYSAWVGVNDYIRETISNFHAPLEFGDIVFGPTGFSIEEIAIRSTKYAFGPVGNPSLFGYNPLIIKINPEKNKSMETLLKLTVEPPSAEKWESIQKVRFGMVKPVQTTYFIPEDLENKIMIQLLDPETKKQLYCTSYTDMAAPFIEFNLEPLYTKLPQKTEPVSFRILTDDQTRSSMRLVLSFQETATGETIEQETFDDLSGTDSHTPVFDIEKLRSLLGGNYTIDCRLFEKESGKQAANFQQHLTKFDLYLPNQFHASETDYSYGGITDHAICIRFPFEAEFVFWRKASYIPWWDVEQAAMTNEFIECWGAGNQGCCEPMQDRECRYSRVKLLENSEARAVVHWRYALSDPHYKIYANEWVDEYYVMYPDGAGVRQVNLWPNTSTRHEMFEVLLAKPPGVKTEQLFDDTFATLSNLQEQGYSNKHFYKNKQEYKAFLEQSDDFIIEVHFKDRMHPFTVFSFRDDLLPGVKRDNLTACSRLISSADRRGHWPASRFQIDGYNIPGLDVPHHGNIGSIHAEIDPSNQPMTWTFLTGVTKKASRGHFKQAKSWLYPTTLEILSKNFLHEGYDFSQRAYLLKTEKSAKQCKVKVLSSEYDLYHPVFLIENPEKTVASVQLDGNTLSPEILKTGTTRNQKTVVFLNTEISEGQVLTFLFQ